MLELRLVWVNRALIIEVGVRSHRFLIFACRYKLILFQRTRIPYMTTAIMYLDSTIYFMRYIAAYLVGIIELLCVCSIWDVSAIRHIIFERNGSWLSEVFEFDLLNTDSSDVLLKISMNGKTEICLVIEICAPADVV